MFNQVSELQLLERFGRKYANLLSDLAPAAPYVPLPGTGTIGIRMQWLLSHSKKMKARGKDIVIAVCGSLFVAAEAREFIYSRNPDLFSPTDWVRECDEPIS